MDAPNSRQQYSANNEPQPRIEPLEFNQCQEAVKKLTEFLSHELRPDEEDKVQQHLRQCRGCFSKFHFEETLLRTIRERAEQVHAPLFLKDKILRLISRPEAAESGPEIVEISSASS